MRGVLYANLGDHARAIAIKERALAMFEQAPGHPNHIAMAHRNMVRSLLALGRVGEAEAELEKAAVASHRDSDETNVSCSGASFVSGRAGRRRRSPTTFLPSRGLPAASLRGSSIR
jgi:hypothetical protein